MTFTYRHRKQIIIITIISALLLVLGGFAFYKFYSTTKSEDKLVIKTSKEDIKKEKEEDTADIYYQVDIKGEVNVPGIYTVKENSRVIDVIRLAGDLTENADTSVLNLSKKVVDEMVIIVYSYDEVANFTETLEKEKAEQEACLNQNEITNDACIEDDNTTSTSEVIDGSIKVSINTATLEELMQLPGIGETKANAIIEYRIKVGSFKNIEELKEVNNIVDSTFDNINKNITI